MEGIDYKETPKNNPHNTPHNWAILKQIPAADEPYHPLDQGQTTQPVPVQVSNKEFTASAFDKPAAMPSPRDLSKNNAQGIKEPSFASPLMAAVSKVLSAEQGAGYAEEERPSAGSSPVSGSGHGERGFRPSILDSVDRGLPQPAAAPASPLNRDNARAQPAAGPSIFDGIGRREPAAAPASPLNRDNVRAQPAAGPSIFDGIGRREPAAAPVNEMRFSRLFNRKSPLTTGVAPGRDMPLLLLLENIALCR
ncbi:hypothetical protein GTU79_00550 [Sodalis ligni]|uniref:hypothetical protein n=1 Tax=Sodalis ligni TaxID=2697027 RepID=UPI001BDF3009|nr:hypothetical protein [Sodalis ligni]QWA11367.1 hypothetical protein GTU79_00550 [Sodalis ligni]